jgi:hypothetical protein
MFLSFTSNSLLAIDVVDAFVRALEGKAPLYEVPKALDDLWYMAMRGSLYSLVAYIGLFIAVVAVGFWCVKFYIALEEGSMKPVAAQMVWPVLIVLLLANGGAKMRDLTIGTRNILNAVNHSVSEVVSTEVNIQTAIMALSGNYEIKKFISSNQNLCNQSADLQKFQDCMKVFGIALETKQRGFEAGIKKLVLPAAFQSKLDPWTQQTETLRQNVLRGTTPQDAQKEASAAAGRSGTTGSAATSGTTPAPTPSTTPSGVLPAGFKPLDASTYSSEEGIRAVIEVLTSSRAAFIYILETMMLVTGLIGPIFVALSLFPVGTKPIVAWAISFLTIGFCKICYSLISGLAAIAMVYAGPENSDMTVASVVLGLFAPVLSFYVASNSGFSALTTVSYSAQGFGLNAGISSYAIGGKADGSGGLPKPQSSPSDESREISN